MSLEVIEFQPKYHLPIFDVLRDPTNTERIWVAGGAARSTLFNHRVSDYDIFFGNMESVVSFQKRLKEMGAKKIAEAAMFDDDTVIGADYDYNGHLVQLKWNYLYDRPEHILERFDFTCCHFFVALGHVKETEFVCGTTLDAIKDSEERKLVLYKVTSPAHTLARVVKYNGKGFTVRSKVEFYNGLVNEIRNMPFSHEAFSPIRKRQVKMVPIKRKDK